MPEETSRQITGGIPRGIPRDISRGIFEVLPRNYAWKNSLMIQSLTEILEESQEEFWEEFPKKILKEFQEESRRIFFEEFLCALLMESSKEFLDLFTSSYRIPFAYEISLHSYPLAGIGPPKKAFVGTPPPNSCPICGIQLAPSDLETHFSAELTRLTKMSSAAERLELRRTLSVDMHAMQNTLQGRTSRWETFKNIRNKRQDRLRGKLRKRKFDGEDGFGLQLGNLNCQSCPVCHGRLQRTQEEIAQHIEDCVRKQQQQHQQQHHQQQQSGQSTAQDEDETVDVESYGDETSNGAINMTSNVIHHTNNSLHNNNNNNNAPIKPDPPMTKLPQMEESAITSLSSIVPHWDRKTRLNLPLNCTATSDNSITRVTPTSSDQRIDVDYEQDHDHSQDMVTDHDEEVIVDNTDDEECIKRSRQTTLTALGSHPCNGNPGMGAGRDEKNSTEEATSSVEIDSATDSMTIRTAGTTPNSDSYVSTSEPTEPASKAQVLEELKARIRELEGSPHYKCFICKVSS
ncbi:hypothetical protein RP20_CCG016356 [Aedes albopictus]|nr:hypothetical protein RP20_CCG016356 [Aedes albopictus]